MILALVIGAAIGAQPAPAMVPGPRERFVICPGSRRCPARPTVQRSESGRSPMRMPSMLDPGPGRRVTYARPSDGGGGPGNTLIFAPGEAALSADARALLDDIAGRAMAADDVEVLLEGHAEPGGADAGSSALAGLRAEAAANHLRLRGVPPERIVAISWGTAGQATGGMLRSVVATVRPQAPPAPAAAGQQRQLFLFQFRPGPAWRRGLPMQGQDLRAHGAYHARLVREGRSVAGGGYVGEEGGMAIIRAANRTEAEALLAADPAIINGVFVAELRQWAPRFHSEAPLVERRP